MSIETSIHPLATALGMEPVTVALCVGVLGGFVLAKLFSSKPPKSSQLTSASLAGTARTTFNTQRPMSITGGSVSLATSEASVEMDLALCSELKRLLKEGNKIEAIKAFREKTNTDLKSAKTLVELFEAQMDKLPDLPR